MYCTSTCLGGYRFPEELGDFVWLLTWLMIGIKPHKLEALAVDGRRTMKYNAKDKYSKGLTAVYSV